jgi:ubiquinone/menaquinone biosynthesis C-methylase UbiE
MKNDSAPLCDYEGYDYRGDFWPGRDYEDVVERIALRKLLPASGERLVEIGAGFGRLADMYTRYSQVILLDPAKSQLRQAQERWADDKRFIYVTGDIYNLPLSTSGFDVVLTVRMLHHLTDLSGAFHEVHRILRPRGTYILEYANKRNLKEIIRYLAGRSRKEPFSPQPVEYVPLHFNFHPSYVEGWLQKAGFLAEETLAVSSLRLAFLKRLLPLSWLARLDGLLQSPTGPLKLAPSIFLLARALKEEEGTVGIFRCPSCGSEHLEERTSSLLCRGCGRSWPIRGGIYDFKQV